jgi:prefoldin subunit 5
MEKRLKEAGGSLTGKRVRELENETQQLRGEIMELKRKYQGEINELTWSLDAAYKDIDRINKVFEKNPEIKEAFAETERTLKQRNIQGPSL